MSKDWGPGWPHGASGEIVELTVGQAEVKLLHGVRVEIEPLVKALVARLEASRGKPFTPGWCWGYNNRPIKGTKIPSNHSRGTGIDLDAPENPHMTKTEHGQPHSLRKKFPNGLVLRSTMPDDVEEIAKRLGFEWGGNFKKPDPMHFEFAGSLADAARLVADLPNQEEDMTPAQAGQLEMSAFAIDKLILPAVGRIEAMVAKLAKQVEAIEKKTKNL